MLLPIICKEPLFPVAQTVNSSAPWLQMSRRFLVLCRWVGVSYISCIHIICSLPVYHRVWISVSSQRQKRWACSNNTFCTSNCLDTWLSSLRSFSQLLVPEQSTCEPVKAENLAAPWSGASLPFYRLKQILGTFSFASMLQLLAVTWGKLWIMCLIWDQKSTA